MSMSEVSSDVVRASDRKEAEEGSLVTMHPVASGDNFTALYKSTHRLKEEIPALVPCCEGRELQINEELLHSGLSAISVKHESVLDCITVTRTCDRVGFVFADPLPEGGFVKHRNSFRSLHRPDLRRVPCLRKMAPQELESLFRGSSPEPKSDSTATLTLEVAPEPPGEETVSVMLPTQDEPPTKMKKCHDEPAGGLVGGTRGSSLGSGAECAGPPPPPSARATAAAGAAAVCGASGSALSADLPSGMRLHGARARLYTSVLGAARARAPGDQLDVISTTETEIEGSEQEDTEERPLAGELQIILPPRRDELPADRSTTAGDVY